METQHKFSLQQVFTDEDMYEIKIAIKGKQNQSQNRRQVPSAFFALFSVMAFISYLQSDMWMLFVYLIAAVGSAFLLYFLGFYDEKGVFIYRLIFAKTLFEQVNFYDYFLEGYSSTKAMSVVLYEEITQVYELKRCLVFKTKQKDFPFIFIAKQNMPNECILFIKGIFQGKYEDVRHQENFILK